jgi:stage II sporulation protein D
MKRLKKILLISVILVMIFSTTSYAYDIKVRIRSPRQENEWFSVSSENDLVLSYSGDEVKELFSLKTSDITARVNGYYSSHEDYSYYSKEQLATDIGPWSLYFVDSETENYDEIISFKEEMKENYDIDSYIFVTGNEYQLWTGQFTSEDDAKKTREKYGDNYSLVMSLNRNEEVIYLYDKNEDILAAITNDSNIIVCSSDKKNYVTIDGKPYRGCVGFYIIEGFKLLSINTVELEDYLMGVVASEMPASWPLESLKVQAIAARTYAVANTIHGLSSIYYVSDNQNSQVYNGVWGENPSTNKAIEETEGEMLYYDDTLIEAYYHSTSGGYTDNSENVWIYPLPYIKGVEDHYSDISPYTDWNIDITEEDLIEILNENDYGVGKIYSIIESVVSEFNRVIELSILTDVGEIILEKEEARRIIGYSQLKSTWYEFEGNNKSMVLTSEGTVEKNLGGLSVLSERDNTNISFEDNKKVITSEGKIFIPSCPDNYTIIGKGFGHGLGMSQYGAKAMADEGFDSNEILKHYYYGVDIK